MELMCRSSLPAPDRFSCLRKCSRDAAFNVMASICCVHFGEIDENRAHRLALVDGDVLVVYSMSTNACIVDRCLRAPHCRSFKRSPTRSRIHHPTKDSSTLPSVAVSEIGRRSDSTALGGCTFGTGTTFASFYNDGTNPSRIDALYRWRTLDRRDDLGSPSGPGALCTFTRLSLRSTSKMLMVNSSGTTSGGGGILLSSSGLR